MTQTVNLAFGACAGNIYSGLWVFGGTPNTVISKRVIPLHLIGEVVVLSDQKFFDRSLAVTVKGIASVVTVWLYSRQFILSLVFKVTGVVALVKLFIKRAGCSVDHSASFNGFPLCDLISPSVDVLVGRGIEKL